MKYSSKMMHDIYKYNLCTYYLLPFCGVTIYTLGGSKNFINCWVNPNEDKLYVKVIRLNICEPHAYDNIFWIGNSNNYIGYRFPKRWSKVIAAYREGKYSEFPLKAKEYLEQYSGLAHNRRAPNTKTGFETDVRLRALYKDDEVRRMIEQDLKCVIEKESELMQKPGEESFMII